MRISASHSHVNRWIECAALERDREGCYVHGALYKQYLRNLGIPVIALATLYVACADPPKKLNRGGGGAGSGAAGSIGDAGSNDDGGTTATGGNGGASGGPALPDAGMGGEAGAREADGGEAGTAGATGGNGGNGGNGGGPVDACTGLTIGKSKMPVPPTTGAAKPSGAVGGFKVVNWAGFKGALSYTFDDSLQNQVTHYEDLNGVGIHLTFYLVNFNQGSNPIWEKAVLDGHELGNHTVHHCNANGTNCVSGTFSTVDKELDDNTAFLMGKAGVTGVYTFAQPYGDNAWVDAASQRFLAARGVSDASGGILPNDGSSPYTLPCHITTPDEKAVGGLNVISDDVRSKGSWRTILMHSVDPTINDGGYQPIQLTEALATMNYTKSLGDVWADTVVAVGAYWRAQKAMSTIQPKSVGSDKIYSWTLPDHFPPGQYVRAIVTGGKVTQCGAELAWDAHGYYEINLDAGSVTISP